MTKYVRDTKAGKALSVKVILNKRGKHVATVQAHYSDNPNGSVCTVNVWQTSAAYLECQRVMCKGVSFASEGEFERAAYCLLYTSPSPRDGLLSRMPSSA